jgi:hypothetical protein|tara:strand:+ start:468 stop:602 length:135 start_codon:yes stop_codon:yes gene_type:complete
MTAWELHVGLYPGVLIGIRHYDEKDYVDIVLYLPFVDICLTIYK